MVLNIETFTNPGAKGWRPGNNVGGSSLFKALGHPLVAAKARALRQRLAASGKVAIYDPLGQAACFDAFYDLAGLDVAGVYVQKVEEANAKKLGRAAQLVTALPSARAATVLLAAFDAKRLADQIRNLIPGGAELVTFDELRLADDMLSNQRNYLDPLNFATNFGFLRDGKGHRTTISSANYWSGYGAKGPELWLCLFGEDGDVLAEWREPLDGANSAFRIDSAEVRARFGLSDFAGSLFIHALRVAGHDVVKYAVDVASADGLGLSCTHDANAWPADLYAGLPAPKEGEKILLWIQNSHPVAIPPGGIGVNIMGSQDVSWSDVSVPAFGTRAIDIGALLPEARWPNQIEVQAGRYFVRPRYEVIRQDGRRRIAHANVERTDLAPDPRIPELSKLMGKGYLMPLPVLPLSSFRTEVLPTPMSTCQHELPLSVALYDASGAEAARRYLGRIARRDSTPVDVNAWIAEDGLKLPAGYGHVEFLYDFRDGGEADGWLHGFGRYEQLASSHVAETIFGAHIYNTPITYKDEPQSYVAKPPGLSTRIFLRLGAAPLDTLCHLIYPASLPWHPKSTTVLSLCDRGGKEVAQREVAIACGGSLFWRVSEMFEADERKRAGADSYVLVVDPTCRLFGFHGLVDGDRAFSFDHMFGF
ncbi:MAG TPA: hypothetical protein VI732_01060 [Alphaproteobacteria bacterium]|nr:hypothetical protein [Alphaproteobacteria bacterium]